MNSQPTLEQRRAADALKKINGLAKDKDGQRKYGNYVSYVSALPATIVSNGLGQALAMLLASAGRKDKPSEDPHYLLYSHVASWLTDNVEGLEKENPNGVIRALMNQDQDTYVRAQAEALGYLKWLKQFGRAYLKEEKQP